MAQPEHARTMENKSSPPLGCGEHQRPLRRFAPGARGRPPRGSVNGTRPGAPAAGAAAAGAAVRHGQQRQQGVQHTASSARLAGAAAAGGAAAKDRGARHEKRQRRLPCRALLLRRALGQLQRRFLPGARGVRLWRGVKRVPWRAGGIGSGGRAQGAERGAGAKTKKEKALLHLSGSNR